MACDFKVEAENPEEVVAKAEEHAVTAHNLPKGEETRAKIRPQIRDVQ